MPTYLRYSDDIEQTQPNEKETTDEIQRVFQELRILAYDKLRHAVRDAHAKSHGILRGELRIDSGLPEELAQGLFATPRTYPVIVRYSTAPGDILPDGMPSFRGMAIKVIGVEGEKVLPEERDAVTQDFLFVNHPTIPTGTVDKYLREIKQLSQLAGQPDVVQKVAAVGTKAINVVANAVGEEVIGVVGQGKRETGLLDQTFFTMAALRYGDYFGKINAVPITPALVETGKEHATHDDVAGLRDMVRRYFATHDAEYEIRIQLCTDLDKMPVEDGGIRWPEEESPYRRVATLFLPAQESYSPARQVYADDILSFNPWHTIPAHRPLGNIQRVRRQAYDESAKFRHEHNVRPRIEPKSIDELPA